MTTPIDVLIRVREIANQPLALNKFGEAIRRATIGANNYEAAVIRIQSKIQKTQTDIQSLTSKIGGLTASQNRGNNVAAKLNAAYAALHTKQNQLKISTIQLQNAHLRLASAMTASSRAAQNAYGTPLGPPGLIPPGITGGGGGTSGGGTGGAGAGKKGAGIPVLGDLSAYGAYFAIVQVADAISNITERTTKYGIAVRLLSQQTGLATEQASVYTLMAERLGVSTETVGESFRTFSDRLSRAFTSGGRQTQGSRDLVNALEQLGVTATRADGSLRPMNEILREAFAGFEKLGPGVEATQFATALFGRNADELLPVLLAGATALSEVEKKALDLGLTLSGDTVEAIKDFDTALRDTEIATLGLNVALAEGLLPIMQIIAQVAGVVLPEAAKTLRYYQNFIGKGVDRFFGGGIGPAIQAYHQTGDVGAAFGAFASNTIFGENISSIQDRLNKPMLLPVPGYYAAVTAGQNVINELMELNKYALTQVYQGTLPPPGVTTTPPTIPRFALGGSVPSIKEYGSLPGFGSGSNAEAVAKMLRGDTSGGGGSSSSTRAFEKYKEDEMQRTRDLAITLLREEEDYLRDRNEKIADALRREYDLEQKHKERLESLEEKWDEILLRLRVGGDAESIALAEQKRQEALDKQKAEDAEEMALEKDRSKEAIDLYDNEYEIKRRRRLEDAELERQDREREFAMRIQTESSGYSTLTSLFDNYANIMTMREEQLAARRVNTYRNMVAEMEAIEVSSRARLRDGMDVGTGGTNMRRAFGGRIPGPLGSPVMFMGHGGERVVPPATPGYYSNVRHGDQFSINAPMTFNTRGSVDASSIARQSSRALTRAVRQARSYIGH